jgi:hypothetical protein
VFVALAPTYPECDAADLEATLNAITELDPITVFHEPVNIRAQNVARIEAHAQALGVRLNTQVFASPAAWRRYAIESLLTVQSLARKLGLADRLHSWPDKSLGTATAAREIQNPAAHLKFIQRCWSRISEWPK